jgi:transposase
MCLHPEPVPPVPAETARVARLAFPRGNPYLQMREEFGSLFEDRQFAGLFPAGGQPAAAPWRLALVLVLQYAEHLSDRQAAEAVRSRLDWKYLLSLELTDPGFDFSVLCEFRSRLLSGAAELLLFELLLQRFRERQLLKARGKQRTDSTHVLAAVRLLNRLESVGESMRHALNSLAELAPGWLRDHCRPEWGERYERRFEEQRLPETPAAREALAQVIGADGGALLTAIWTTAAPGWLRQVPAVETLRQVWLQQYTGEPTAAGARLRWRTEEELPPLPQRIISPYDPEARYGKKRSTTWLGYKVHFTETCEPQQPVLITDVQTTPPLTVDSETVPTIHSALARRDLLPDVHTVDAGYVDAGTLVSSQTEHQVDLVGPALADTSWQAQAGQGFAASDFTICWEGQYAICPEGKQSIAWHEKEERGQPVMAIYFSRPACRACPRRSDCTRSAAGRRLTVRPEPEHRALQAARERERTAAFRQLYACRAGVEGTHTQALRRCGLRRSRYVGTAKTQLQHLLTAAALNFVRVAAWLTETPRARTRQSAFVRLMAAA